MSLQAQASNRDCVLPLKTTALPLPARRRERASTWAPPWTDRPRGQSDTAQSARRCFPPLKQMPTSALRAKRDPAAQAALSSAQAKPQRLPSSPPPESARRARPVR